MRTSRPPSCPKPCTRGSTRGCSQSEISAVGNAYTEQRASSEENLAYLAPRQARDSSDADANAGTKQRPWDFWVCEVKVSPLYINALRVGTTGGIFVVVPLQWCWLVACVKRKEKYLTL
ncbi:hypothetical protein F5B17DRAFT_16925 [Nemania serpens]|nr:hypothetical protein F5B17DRAFT_16925 [Nemania serpens]